MCIRDRSSTTDLTTLVLVFPPLNEDDAYTVLPFFWLPEDTLALRLRRDHVMYDVWEKQGFLKTTEGNVVHYGFIEQFICQLGERYNIREIAYDRWNASMMVQTLQDDGFTTVSYTHLMEAILVSDMDTEFEVVGGSNFEEEDS